MVFTSAASNFRWLRNLLTFQFAEFCKFFLSVLSESLQIKTSKIRRSLTFEEVMRLWGPSGDHCHRTSERKCDSLTKKCDSVYCELCRILTKLSQRTKLFYCIEMHMLHYYFLYEINQKNFFVSCLELKNFCFAKLTTIRNSPCLTTEIFVRLECIITANFMAFSTGYFLSCIEKVFVFTKPKFDLSANFAFVLSIIVFLSIAWMWFF